MFDVTFSRRSTADSSTLQMAKITTVLFCYLKAHEILWKLGYWRYLLVPIALSALLLPVIVVAFFLSYGIIGPYLERYIPGAGESPHLVILIVIFSIIMGMAGPLFVLYRGLVMLCYSPFLNRLSASVEETIGSGVTRPDRRIVETARRAILVLVGAVFLSLVAVFAGAILNLIPVLGTILFLVMLLPIHLFLSSLSYVDPHLDRNGMSVVAAFKLMVRNAVPMTIFGAVGLAVMSIPVFGWFVGPTYSVIAGIVFAMIILEETGDSGEPRAAGEKLEAPEIRPLNFD